MSRNIAVAAKIPYSHEEDEALVDFVRQNNGWHRVRGNWFWETSFRYNKELRRSPHSARERFLKRIINFDAHPANRKLFTEDEIKILEHTDSDSDHVPSLNLGKLGDSVLRLSSLKPCPTEKCKPDLNVTNVFSQNYFKTESKNQQITADSAIQAYETLMAVESFPMDTGLEHEIMTSLETVIYMFEKLLKEKGLAIHPNEIEEENYKQRFKFLVNYKYTGDVLIDRLPGTLITLALMGKEICLDRSKKNC